MTSRVAYLGGSARAAILCLGWGLSFAVLANAAGAAVLVVLGVLLVTLGAEWIVDGMDLGESRSRIACYAMAVILLVVAFAAIVALRTLLLDR
jgi:hypothetical protein